MDRASATSPSSEDVHQGGAADDKEKYSILSIAFPDSSESSIGAKD
jgi:hypothetical protein